MNSVLLDVVILVLIRNSFTIVAATGQTTTNSTEVESTETTISTEPPTPTSPLTKPSTKSTTTTQTTTQSTTTITPSEITPPPPDTTTNTQPTTTIAPSETTTPKPTTTTTQISNPASSTNDRFSSPTNVQSQSKQITPSSASNNTNALQSQLSSLVTPTTPMKTPATNPTPANFNSSIPSSTSTNVTNAPTTPTTLTTPTTTKPPLRYPTVAFYKDDKTCPFGYKMKTVTSASVCVHLCEDKHCQNDGHCYVDLDVNREASAKCRCKETGGTIYKGDNCEDTEFSRSKERGITLGILIPISAISLLIIIVMCTKVKRGSNQLRSVQKSYDINNL